MNSAAIETVGLTKFYGKQRGVLDLTMTVQPGEVFGYLGPNGAGKTTTIRTLLDFIRPSQGSARVFGLDSVQHSVQIRCRTGYLPGELSLYGHLTGMEMVRYAGHLWGRVNSAYAQQLAGRLDADLTRPIRTLSHGNKQKVGLILAFVNQPDLVILDEPTQGLDPLVQQEFYKLLSDVRAEGRTVFLSSHVLPEVERICDRVGIIREGRLVTVEAVAALKERALRRLEIHFDGPVPEAEFQGLPGVRDLSMQGNVLYCTVTGSLDAVIKAAARRTVLNLISHEPSLEDVFLAYYGRGNEHVA